MSSRAISGDDGLVAVRGRGSAPAATLSARSVNRFPTWLSRPAGTEERITIDTHGAEIDVRQALSFIASHSGINLIYSPEINRKVRLQLIDVPVSDALQAVLAVAGLTLESTTPKARATGSSAVVFYELPVNVDSLSADAIMKRFGVGRAIAELLVQGRNAKP